VVVVGTMSAVGAVMVVVGPGVAVVILVVRSRRRREGVDVVEEVLVKAVLGEEEVGMGREMMGEVVVVVLSLGGCRMLGGGGGAGQLRLRLRLLDHLGGEMPRLIGGDHGVFFSAQCFYL